MDDNQNHDMNGSEQDVQMEVENKEEQKHMGPLMGIVIIIVILVFGGLYFWGARINNAEYEKEEIPQILGDDGSKIIPQDGNPISDSPENIETDFSTSDFDDLDAQIGEDLSAIEFELQ
jgi:hypothetical protein